MSVTSKIRNTSLCVNAVELDEWKKIRICSILLSRNLTLVCFRMVRRGVLFAVCSLFLSVNSQSLLTDFGDQLFETRSWLAGKRNRNCGWFKIKRNNFQSLQVIYPWFNYKITQSARDVHSHTQTAVLSISGKDIKPGRPVPHWSSVRLLTHLQLCIFVSVRS